MRKCIRMFAKKALPTTLSIVISLLFGFLISNYPAGAMTSARILFSLLLLGFSLLLYYFAYLAHVYFNQRSYWLMQLPYAKKTILFSFLITQFVYLSIYAFVLILIGAIAKVEPADLFSCLRTLLLIPCGCYAAIVLKEIFDNTHFFFAYLFTLFSYDALFSLLNRLSLSFLEMMAIGAIVSSIMVYLCAGILEKEYNGGDQRA